MDIRKIMTNRHVKRKANGRTEIRKLYIPQYV